jgi:hypothetical protein
MWLSAVLALAACSGEKKNNADILAQDSSLTRDLQLANLDTAAQPQLKDIPATPPATVEKPAAPRVVERPRPTPKPAPKPTPAPKPVPKPAPAPVVTASGNTVEPARSNSAGNSEGRVGVISAGSTLSLNAGQRVCTNTNTVGDRFTATLANAVTGSNGAVIPAGAVAVVEVTSLKQSEQAGDNMGIGLVVRSIRYAGKTYPVNGEIADAQVEQVRSAKNNDAGKVLGGAAIGAILGNIFGGKSKAKGTVIGAAGGAAAGAVIAHQTANYDACIPSGGRITVRLNQPMSIQSTSNDNVPANTTPVDNGQI